MNEQERQRLAEFLRNEVCGQLDRIRKFELGVEGAPPFSELAASYTVTMIAAVLATQPRRLRDGMAAIMVADLADRIGKINEALEERPDIGIEVRRQLYGEG